MPELPEVETICRGLAKTINDCKIISAKKYRENIRSMIPANICDLISGSMITSVSRKAKYIVMGLSNSYSIIFHLGMSGKILLYSEDYIISKHDHFRINLSGNKTFIFNDARRFGLIEICKTQELTSHKLFASLGPEPLDYSFNEDYLHKKLLGRKLPIKVAIMDARIVVGVGNIYASESLFRSKINPEEESGKISKAKLQKLCVSIKEVLSDAINSGGSTLRDYVQSSGDVGSFQHKFHVYGKEGKSCSLCGTDIQRIIQGGRSTFFCQKCQR
jgi:formamidopyrimidine-DNA glycosylase